MGATAEVLVQDAERERAAERGGSATARAAGDGAGGVRVDGDDETQRKEHEREGDQEETLHRVLACVPSEYS